MRASVDSLEMAKDLVRGSAFLATGGGGDPFLGEMILTQAVREREVEYISPGELPDDALIVCVAGMGAPTVVLESLISREVWSRLLQAMERHLGRKVDALISGEIGGLNAVIPLAVAAQMGIPVVDGDGIGRALPKIEMCSFSIYGTSCTPMFVTNEMGDMVFLENLTSNSKCEQVARTLTMTLGGAMVEVCTYVMTGAEVKVRCVPDTLSLCLEIGSAIRKARETSGSPVENLVEVLNAPERERHAKLLFDGKITDLQRETRDGWHFATVSMLAMDGSGDTFEIDIQNEYLIGRKNGKTVCMVPDLVCIVDRESGEPITAEKLKYGQRLKVIGLSASPVLRRQEALEVVGPQAFGIDEPFVPIEQISGL